jgi:hypothetical protein
MNQKRKTFVKRIQAERERQFDLPGRECDVSKGTDNWCATVLRYVGEVTNRGGRPPLAGDFEDAMIKAGAVVLAALEHIDVMKSKGCFSDECDNEKDFKDHK